jgi:hypothetical protein
MAQITIGDLTGSAQIDTSDTSLAAKSQLTSLFTSTKELVTALPQPVSGASFQDAQLSADFAKSSIPLGNNSVAIKAGVNASLTVFRSGDSPLFAGDAYGDPIAIGANECWVSFELDTSLDASVAVPLPYGFGVGFEASSAPDFSTYLLIPAAQSPNTTLAQAIGQTLDAFKVLDSSADVLALAQNLICVTDVAGTIKVGGSWSLPLAVNQLSLASASLPFNQSVSVSPSLSLGVQGDIALTGEFGLRVRRTGPNLIHIGIYKSRGTTFDASFTASAGVGANLGGTDLVNEFFTAIDPGIDASQSGSGADFQKVLSASIDRSLAISLNAACSAAFTDEAAVIYEIDVTAPDQATKDAIDSALTGDWTRISQLPNARKIRNVITDTVEKKYTLTVNLLGLYNYISVADFVQSMQLVTDPTTGKVVITDTETAKQIAVASTPLVADPDRLRLALYNSFLATATYQALISGSGVTAGFSAKQEFVLYRASMGYRPALSQLNTGEVLGVMPPSVKSALPAAGSPVGHARFAATCNYSNDDVLRFFFTDIQKLTPRKTSDLEKIGRNVLASLLDPEDPTDLQRMQVLYNDAAWAAMDATGSNIPAPYYSDWFDITVSWAPSIAQVGPILADTIAYARTVKGDPSKDPAFMKKRANLAHAIAAATRNTKAAFNPNFPICVMATLAGLTPGDNVPSFSAAWNSTTLFSNVQTQPATQAASAQAAS